MAQYVAKHWPTMVLLLLDLILDILLNAAMILQKIKVRVIRDNSTVEKVVRTSQEQQSVTSANYCKL